MPDILEQMVEDAYAWAAAVKSEKSVDGFFKPMGIREAKRAAIREALLIPGISQKGVAELTGTSKATVNRVVREKKAVA